MLPDVGVCERSDHANVLAHQRKGMADEPRYDVAAKGERHHATHWNGDDVAAKAKHARKLVDMEDSEFTDLVTLRTRQPGEVYTK